MSWRGCAASPHAFFSSLRPLNQVDDDRVWKNIDLIKRREAGMAGSEDELELISSRVGWEQLGPVDQKRMRV